MPASYVKAGRSLAPMRSARQPEHDSIVAIHVTSQEPPNECAMGSLLVGGCTSNPKWFWHGQLISLPELFFLRPCRDFPSSAVHAHTSQGCGLRLYRRSQGTSFGGPAQTLIPGRTVPSCRGSLNYRLGRSALIVVHQTH